MKIFDTLMLLSVPFLVCPARAQQTASASLIMPPSMNAVVPFACADPNTCLDGSTFSPSIGICVSLGKFNLTTTDSPSQGYLLTTPSGTTFFNQTSTAWFLKAVLYGRKCLDIQFSTDSSFLAQSLQSICNIYLDSSGLNKCSIMQQDARCKWDAGTSISAAVAIAISSDMTQATLDARKSICMCSCAADIVAVYSGILLQWSLINPSLSSKIGILQSMCSSDFKRTVSAVIYESTSVQCATNNISISLSASDNVPNGSVITIIGLNAKLPQGGMQILTTPSFLLSSFLWTEASCTDYCPPTKLCPGLSSCNPSGSGWQAGVQRPSRCVPWCDTDAVLQITTKGTFVNANISILLENGCLPNQPLPTIFVSINGPSFFVPVTPVVQMQQVLTFQSPPALAVLSISEDAADTFDAAAGIWRGNALGQRNTVKFVVQPNVDVFAGANITISGMISAVSPTKSFPTVRQSPLLLSNIVVDSWVSISGTVVLRLISPNSSAVMIAGNVYSFGLEVDMPQDISDALSQGPTIALEASGLGPRRACCCISAKQTIRSQVLVPRQTLLPTFPVQSIGQSTCSPGECNTVTVTISVNQVVTSPRDNVYCQISGFLGMDTDPSCSSSICEKNPSRIPLQDGIAGSNAKSLFQSVDGSIGRATWNSSAGTLKLVLANQARLEPFKQYVIAFNLKNGFTAALSSNVIITAFVNGSCVTQSGLTCSGVVMNQILPTRLEVCPARFDVRIAGQSFPWPGCDGLLNTVTVTIQPNVRLSAGSRITIIGFAGASKVTSSNSSVSFADGSVFVDVASGEALYSGQNYVYTLSLLNPSISQVMPYLSLEASSLQPPFAIPRALVIGNQSQLPTIFSGSNAQFISSRTFPGDALPMYIAQPSFVVKTIGQSNPYPNALNTITITLAANVPIEIGSTVTIQGLSGSVSPDPNFAVTNISSVIFSTATWNSANSTLILTAAAKWRTTDPWIVFSFNLANSRQCQSSPTVNISASLTGTTTPVCPSSFNPPLLGSVCSPQPTSDSLVSLDDGAIWLRTRSLIGWTLTLSCPVSTVQISSAIQGLTISSPGSGCVDNLSGKSSFRGNLQFSSGSASGTYDVVAGKVSAVTLSSGGSAYTAVPSLVGFNCTNEPTIIVTLGGGKGCLSSSGSLIFVGGGVLVLLEGIWLRKAP